jgi:hypothetical protein
MRYHAASVLIIDPFGSILHIAAACCFEDSSWNAGVRWHKRGVVVKRLMPGHDQLGPADLNSPTVLEP